MFQYFGYGSNLNLTALRAKGVEPGASERATLHGWKLLFNVRHWFRHEGGVGNIQPTNNPADQVQGLVHQCEDRHLPLLDAMESYGTGYDRIEVELQTQHGPVRALTYVGLPAYLDNRRLPTRRYRNILVKGASAAGLDSAYIDALRQQPIQADPNYPPFQVPTPPTQIFDQETLAQHSHYTAIAGVVFDMQDARQDLACVQSLFGGKDMTLFLLKRLDTSDGSETLEDVKQDNISEPGRKYLNAYLHEFNAEFRYVGRYTYA